MSLAASLQKRVDGILRRFDVTDRAVFKRFTTVANDDPLTGRGGSASSQDTLLDPQPSVVVASKEYPLVVAGAQLSADAEYLVTVSATAMSRAEVTDPTLSIVFKDDDSNEERLFVCGFQATFVNGADILYELVLTSKQR